MLLQARRKVAAALGQSWRQVGICIAVVIADHAAIVHAENTAASAFAIAAAIVVIVILGLLVMSLAMAVAIALSQGELRQCHQQQPADRKEKDSFQHCLTSGSNIPFGIKLLLNREKIDDTTGSVLSATCAGLPGILKDIIRRNRYAGSSPTDRGMAAWPGSSGRNSANPPAAALDFSSRPGTDLLFRILFTALPGERADRPARHSSRRRVPGRGGKVLFWRAALLASAYPLLAGLKQSCAHARLLAGNDRLA